MTLIWAALSSGAIYALLAITYNVIYTSVGVFNFAQGAILTLGAYISYYVADQLKWPSYLAVLLAAAACAAAGVLEARVVLLPKAMEHAELLTTVGAATVIVGTMIIIWTELVRTSTSPVSSRVFTLFGGRVDADQFILIGLAVVMTVGLELWYRFTLRAGRAWRSPRTGGRPSSGASTCGRRAMARSSWREPWRVSPRPSSGPRRTCTRSWATR